MEIFLHRICGKTAEPPVPMLLRRCTAEEAPVVYALQNEVRAAMPHPEQFVPDSELNPTDPAASSTAQQAYIGNVNSKKFHLPTCANLPAEKNQILFSSYDEAIAAGYTPCASCIK